ncbi:hypothetical protein PHMEG_00030104 [Phytophthora megakarya]|uniref:DUF6570 domain-containing protein n=1 Tax=Phytophthora megakarya TaxID=4795 RepID=A0A225V1E6_9STRA|nr:hypothetical protein PHMEG_00030104 [Phytophthora megakarya]
MDSMGCPLLGRNDYGDVSDERSDGGQDAEASGNGLVVGICPVDANETDRIFVQCAEMISSDNMDETVCCVCDTLYPCRELQVKRVSECKKLVENMQERLKGPSNLPLELLTSYSVSDLVPELHGILLSRNGIKHIEEREPQLQICSSCFQSLRNKRLKKCPKFAIANGLFIGKLPDKFADTIMTKNAMLNRAQPMRYLAVVRGGKHASLRSHAYMFRSNPDCPAQLLFRRVISEGIIRVVLVGAMTTRQKAHMMKKFEVRSDRLRDQLRWYQERNCKFSSTDMVDASSDGVRTAVVIDREFEEKASPNDSSQISLDGDVSRLLDAATQRFNAPAPAHEDVTNEVDEECEQQAIGMVTDFEHEHDVEGALRLLQGDSVVVRRSSDMNTGRWRFVIYFHTGVEDWMKIGQFQSDWRTMLDIAYEYQAESMHSITVFC